MHILILAKDVPYKGLTGLGTQLQETLKAFEAFPEFYFTLIGHYYQGTKSGPNWRYIAINTGNSGDLGNNFLAMVYASNVCSFELARYFDMVDEKIDLIHIFDYCNYYTALGLQGMFDCPIVYCVAFLNAEQLKNRIQNIDNISTIEYNMMKYANQIVTVSDFYHKYIPTEYHDKTMTIYNGWGSETAIKFERHKRKIKNILFLGRWSDTKGANDLQVATMRSDWPKDIKLVITEQKTLSDSDIKKGFEDHPENITLKPYVHGKEKWQLIQDCDAVIMPSKSEPFGLVAIEAQISMRPLICTGNEGLGEILVEDSYIKCELSSVGIIKAIKKLLKMTDKELYNLTERGKLNAQKYTWAKVASKTRKMYHKFQKDITVVHNHPSTIKTKYGNFTIYRHDLASQKVISWSNKTITNRKWIYNMIPKKGVVIDAGANLGFDTVIFSEIVGLSGKVYSFEPFKHSYDLLCKNIKQNNCHNVVTANVCLGDKVQTVLLSDPMREKYDQYYDSSNCSVSDKGIIYAKMTTVDDEIIDKVDLVILDTPNCNEQILRGANDMITKSRPIILYNPDFDVDSFCKKYNYHQPLDAINYKLLLPLAKMTIGKYKSDRLDTIINIKQNYDIKLCDNHDKCGHIYPVDKDQNCAIYAHEQYFYGKFYDDHIKWDHGERWTLK